MTLNSNLEAAFHPRSIAFVGVSRSDDRAVPGFTGLRFLKMYRDAGFKGNLYPINPKADTIENLKVYPSLSSIPEPLDLVVVAIPAKAVPKILEECVAVKARNVHICSSGFAETGEPLGQELERNLRAIAAKSDINIIGPNSMGLHIPSVGLRMFERVPLLDGPAAFISQSGTIAMEYLKCAPNFGFGSSKVISYGNALTLDSTDFLEYLATDDDTKVIGMYLEGIKDGKRLTRLVKETNTRKPIVIMKAGLTSPGARAAASHTGSLTGLAQTWSAFFRQTRAIKVDSILEMAEITMTLLKLKPSPRMGVGLLSAGGGPTVAAGDVCAGEGLDCPALSQDTQKKLKEFVVLVNQGLANPMDLPGVMGKPPLLQRTLDILADDPMIDVIILQIPSDAFSVWPASWATAFKEYVLQFNRENRMGKSAVIAMYDDAHIGNDRKFAAELRQQGFIAYGSLQDACRALKRFSQYYKSIDADNR